MAHGEHEHGTYWHLHEMRAEAQQLTDHDRGRDQRAQAPPRQPNDRHKQNGEGNPATTLSTRCTPFTSVLARVACTTSKAVSAAIRGGGSRKPTSSATTKAATVAPVIRAARDNADRQRVRTRLPARAVVVRATLRNPHQIPSTRVRNGPLPTVTTVSPCTSGTSGSAPDDSTLEPNTRNRCCTNGFHAPTGRMQGMVIRRVSPLRVWVDYVGGGVSVRSARWRPESFPAATASARYTPHDPLW